MRKTFASAVVISVAAGASGVGALDNLSLLGTDRLKPLIIQVLTACPNAAGTTFVGTGNGAAEGGLRNGTQTIAAMSRFLAAGNTCAFSPDATEAEALQVGLDAVSIVLHESARAACDPDSATSGTACVTDVPTGIRYSDSAPAAPLTCGMAVNDWRAVLRLIYFGLRPLDVSACQHNPNQRCSTNADCPVGDSCITPWNVMLTARDCKDPCRVELVDAWGKLFENACSGGDCTKLQHAFRPDENSPTTNAFRELLSARDLNASIGDGNAGFPFCNEYEPAAGDTPPSCPAALVGGGVLGAPGLPVRPYLELYQDADPIRRPALGTGNLSLDLKTPPPLAATEQVASARGNLGVVLPISVPPLTGTITNAERHARIGTITRGADQVPTQYCTRGFFKNAAAAQIAAAAPTSAVCPPGPAFALCPNGDVPKGACWDDALGIAIGGAGVCPYPAFDADGNAATTNDQDVRCLNGANNRPNFSSGVNQMSAARKAACITTGFDGRVYNLHPHLSSGQYVTQVYAYNGGVIGVPGLAARPVVGAYYRIHETRTAINGFAGCVGERCCQLSESTQQIGCLVGASPCSIGMSDPTTSLQEVATVSAADGVVHPQSVFGGSLNGIEYSADCLQRAAYPTARFLWVATMLGFRSGGVIGDELELAKCLSGNGLNNGLTIQQMVHAEGLYPLPIGCKSFDESQPSCGDGGPTNSCLNNPTGVAGLLASGEACAANAECASQSCVLSRCSL